jgi:hypothetical protein
MISLAHVKSSQIEAKKAILHRRIAWPGGNLKSNKEEALQKFFERKRAAEARDQQQTTSPSHSVITVHGRTRTIGPKVNHMSNNNKKGHQKKISDAKPHKGVKNNIIVRKQPRGSKIVKAKQSGGLRKVDVSSNGFSLPTTEKLSMCLDDIVRNRK